MNTTCQSDSLVKSLLNTIEEQDPKYLASIQNARNAYPTYFDELGERILHTLLKAYPSRDTDMLFDAYRNYTFDQNLQQARYEESGGYQHTTARTVKTEVYEDARFMQEYMEALLLTQFLWPHHLQISHYYSHVFVPKVTHGATTALELGPGHGFFGRSLIQRNPDMQLLGIDISPTAAAFSETLAETEGLASSCKYEIGDATNPDTLPKGPFDVVIAGELLEHVDRPDALLQLVSERLAPNGCAFFTAAITAASLDHVFEFHSAEEVHAHVAAAGLTTCSEMLVTPPTGAKHVKRIPQVLALIAERSSNG